MVVTARSDIALGGLNAALLGIGNSVFAPIIGALADKYGQRVVISIAGIINALAMLALTAVSYSEMPAALVVLCGFIAGASSPNFGPMSRTRAACYLKTRFGPAEIQHYKNKLFAHETLLDEFSFVAGPIIVGVTSLTLNPAVPMLAAAVLTAVFALLFAYHPSVKFTLVAPADRVQPASRSAIFKAPVLVVTLGAFAIGTVFGTILTSLTAVMTDYQAAETTGIWYSIMGVSSAVVALFVTRLPAALSPAWRWIITTALISLGAVTFTLLAAPQWSLTLAMLLLGAGIGPTLVTIYTIGSERSPRGHEATIMTLLGGVLTLGQSLTAAFTGYFADHFSAQAATLLPLASSLLLLAVGFMNLRISTKNRANT